MAFSPSYGTESDAYYAAGSLTPTFSNLAVYSESQPDAPLMFVGGGARASVTQVRPFHPTIPTIMLILKYRSDSIRWTLIFSMPPIVDVKLFSHGIFDPISMCHLPNTWYRKVPWRIRKCCLMWILLDKDLLRVIKWFWMDIFESRVLIFFISSKGLFMYLISTSRMEVMMVLQRQWRDSRTLCLMVIQVTFLICFYPRLCQRAIVMTRFRGVGDFPSLPTHLTLSIGLSALWRRGSRKQFFRRLWCERGPSRKAKATISTCPNGFVNQDVDFWERHW